MICIESKKNKNSPLFIMCTVLGRGIEVLVFKQNKNNNNSIIKTF